MGSGGKADRAAEYGLHCYHQRAGTHDSLTHSMGAVLVLTGRHHSRPSADWARRAPRSRLEQGGLGTRQWVLTHCRGGIFQQSSPAVRVPCRVVLATTVF